MERGRVEPGEVMAPDPPWQPWTPREVAERLAGVGTRWYVVAGWALDLFRGAKTREHEDIEIGVPAAGFAEVRVALADYECDVVGSNDDGVGRRWPLDSAAFGEHFQSWFREPSTGVYHLDVFRDPHDGDTWWCRRDMSIRRPYDEVVRTSVDGIPYLAPEIALLFKAKAARAKDEADLEGVLPLLSAPQRDWLRSSLDRVHPGHPWLVRLG
ncbi:MAG TPA: hypothetical protein VGZ03_10920 [Acidimicrobiales bacterium]|nr:hypothetical protein [Acidimicrobiales bacterium]